MKKSQIYTSEELAQMLQEAKERETAESQEESEDAIAQEIIAEIKTISRIAKGTLLVVVFNLVFFLASLILQNLK